MVLRIWCLTIVCALSLFASAPPVTLAAVAGEPAEAPFTLQGGSIVMQMTVKGKGSFRVLLATAAPVSKFSYEALKAMNLQMSYTGVGETRPNDIILFTTVPDPQIGTLKLSHLNVVVGDMSGVSKRLGMNIDGMLGYNFLKDHVVQIDYAKGVVRFLPESPSAQPGVKVAAVSLDRGQDEPSTVIEDVFVEGKKIKALLDTTQGGALALTPAAIKLLGQIPPEVKSPPREGSVSDLKIGDLSCGKTEVAFFAKGAGLDHGLKKYGAIIGNGLLNNFTVTLNYGKNVVIFEER